MIHERRILRRVPSDAEALLWQALRRKALDGWRFRRQSPVAGVNVPILCARARLAVMLHQDALTDRAAARRDHRALQNAGYRVLWLSEAATSANLSQALSRIKDALYHE
jgi:very-short-patch-repair endonuclease